MRLNRPIKLLLVVTFFLTLNSAVMVEACSIVYSHSYIDDIRPTNDPTKLLVDYIFVDPNASYKETRIENKILDLTTGEIQTNNGNLTTAQSDWKFNNGLNTTSPSSTVSLIPQSNFTEIVVYSTKNMSVLTYTYNGSLNDSFVFFSQKLNAIFIIMPPILWNIIVMANVTYIPLENPNETLSFSIRWDSYISEINIADEEGIFFTNAGGSYCVTSYYYHYNQAGIEFLIADDWTLHTLFIDPEKDEILIIKHTTKYAQIINYSTNITSIFQWSNVSHIWYGDYIPGSEISTSDTIPISEFRPNSENLSFGSFGVILFGFLIVLLKKRGSSNKKSD